MPRLLAETHADTYALAQPATDDHIGGSPFRTLVVANTIEPSLSWIYGQGLTYSEAGLSSKFFVQVCRGVGKNPHGRVESLAHDAVL